MVRPIGGPRKIFPFGPKRVVRRTSIPVPVPKVPPVKPVPENRQAGEKHHWWELVLFWRKKPEKPPSQTGPKGIDLKA